VSLIEVPEVECDMRPIQPDAGVEPFDQLMQPIAANHPLGRDADIFAEDMLEGALADAAADGQAINGKNRGVFPNARDKPIDLGDCGVRRREDGAEPAASGLDE
jgi:hypothetical protein